MRTYIEICSDIGKCKTGKDYRKIHKELKQIGEEGLPMFMRYPNLPTYVQIVVLLFELLIIVVAIVHQIV